MSEELRVGIGYDVHPFAEGRPLILGGIALSHTRGLAGHSDADVLLHAIADALLGAAGLGDIGQQFPPGDPQYAGIASTILLERVAMLLARDGWRIANIDSTLIAERPRINPAVPRMRERIAATLGIEPARIGVKATTNERLGFVGREEGIAAIAVALLQR
ncbi:MAG TPA: 2-C-methyl-D-erythritol 2,4-cyclodiphosphate synthase [Chloroflexota bacterium]|jgi:2-C-methyl-D-erythritol 2,4-cyclodiphosphate synthase|nr:2-C-methyl-D-erythritol 2,4-cyclodiphosphate synthase [Chloroflexota bacterium]